MFEKYDELQKQFDEILLMNNIDSYNKNFENDYLYGGYSLEEKRKELLQNFCIVLDKVKEHKQNTYIPNIKNYDEDIKKEFLQDFCFLLNEVKNYKQNIENNYIENNYNENDYNENDYNENDYNENSYNEKNYSETILLKNQSSFSKTDSLNAIKIVVVVVIIITTIFSLINPNETINFICLSLFQSIGLYFFVLILLKRKKQKERCTYLVRANVIEIKRYKKINKIHIYYPIYEFEYNNIKYKINKICYGSISYDKFKMGTKSNFYININDVNDLYKEKFNLSEFVLFSIFALFLYSVPILDIIVYLSSL